jgi:cell division topological specificity factor
MIEFIRRLFGQPGSSATAKERLRLVLMTDHLELAPDMIDAMKREFVDVISRYVEVDRDRIDVTFEQQDRTLAMLANIPILSVHRPNGNGKTKEAPAAPPATASVACAPNVASPGAQAATESLVVRRRRRRKKNPGGSRGQRPATAT